MNGLPFFKTAREKGVPVKIAQKPQYLIVLQRPVTFSHQVLVKFAK